MGHVQIIRQLPLSGIHHVLVAHHSAGLGQVVQGVHGAPVAAFQQLLRFLTLAQRGQSAACCGCIQHVLGVCLFYCLGKHSGFLGPQLLHDSLHLSQKVCPARAQRLRPEALPLRCGGDLARLDDPAHHVPQDTFVQLVPRGRHKPSVAVNFVRGQHGVTRW